MPLQYHYKKHGITQSILTAFLKCRKYSELSLAGWQRKGPESPALLFGSYFHELLARTYVKGKHPSKQFLVELNKEVRKEWKLQKDELTLMARMMLIQYFQHWRNDFAKVEWTGIEQEFVHVHRGLPLRGKFDAVFKINNRLWLKESKTRSFVDERNLIESLNFDTQVMFYLFALWKITGKIPKGVIYDIIRKPQLRKRTNESVVEFIQRCRQDVKKRRRWYFLRFEVVIGREELESFEKELDNILDEFTAWRNGKMPTIKNTTACFNRYGACQFLGICSRGDFSNYEIRKEVHTELEKAEV